MATIGQRGYSWSTFCSIENIKLNAEVVAERACDVWVALAGDRQQRCSCLTGITGLLNKNTYQGLRVEDVMYIVKQKDLMIDSNEIMSDIPKLNFDMISKILDMRMKTKREDRYKEEHEYNFMCVENELLCRSISVQARYDGPHTKVEDAVYISAREILHIIRGVND